MHVYLVLQRKLWAAPCCLVVGFTLRLGKEGGWARPRGWEEGVRLVGGGEDHLTAVHSKQHERGAAHILVSPRPILPPFSPSPSLPAFPLPSLPPPSPSRFPSCHSSHPRPCRLHAMSTLYSEISIQCPLIIVDHQQLMVKLLKGCRRAFHCFSLPPLPLLLPDSLLVILPTPRPCCLQIEGVPQGCHIPKPSLLCRSAQAWKVVQVHPPL